MDLFSTFPDLNLKNRAVMAPMTRYSCSKNGNPTEKMINYYVKRAKSDVGLIILESCAVNDKEAMGYLNGAQFHSYEHALNWKPLVNQIKTHGAKVWIQLFHAGRLTVEEVTKAKVVAPSAIKPYDSESFWRPRLNGDIVHFQTKTNFGVPSKLSKKGIKEIIKQFANSCNLSEKAGFDGVELHGAHGYLLHQFCHNELNKRTDEYNAKDFKFIKELIKSCREATSPMFKISYRLSLHLVDNSYIRYSKDNLDYGKLIKILDKEGVDVFHISEINSGSNAFGSDYPLHEIARKHTKKPIITCGRIDNLEKANKLLKKGNVDLVAIGRALISNPDLISQFKKKQKMKFKKFNYNRDIEEIN